MQLSFTQKKHIRKNFGKLVEGLSIPNLIEVQKNSYNEFLKSKSLNDQISDLSKGLDKVFKSIFPIEDGNDKSTLEYISYKLEKPKFRFATLQERLLHNLTSSEARKSKNGAKRPPPFDAYCPSMMEKLDNCVCAKCGSCWPSAAAKTRHLKAHKGWNLRFEFKVLYSSLCTTGNWSKLH